MHRGNMKIGNQYSDILDNFTENYSKIVQTLIRSTSVQAENDIQPKPSYADFLDKFSRHQIEATRKDSIKEQIFKFVTTENNRDNHLCELILRKVADRYKIKLTHYSGSFDYAGYQAIWHFADSEEKTADQVFTTLTHVLNDIKRQHNVSQKHSVALAPIIREAVKTVAETHQYRKNILSLDEGDLQQGESDWQQTIYGSKYPEYQEEPKQEKLSGYHEKANIKRTSYVGRNTKITEEI